MKGMKCVRKGNSSVEGSVKILKRRKQKQKNEKEENREGGMEREEAVAGTWI